MKNERFVYVLSKDGKPLMPTKRFDRVRRMLKRGKAVVVSRCPFQIQLTYDSTAYTQKIVLGVDTGSKHIGLSACSEKDELYAAEVRPRKESVKSCLESRKMRRRTRRSRLRSRAERSNNRKKNKKEGWFAPTIQQKCQMHVNAVRKVNKLLPISEINVEVCRFDTQKLQNPDIEGVEYQNGVQKGFDNVKAYVRYRDGYKCQVCKGESGSDVLHVHHIVFRSQGGTDNPSNLITLCETCHKAIHDGSLKVKLRRRKKVDLDDVSFVNSINRKIVEMLKEEFGIPVNATYGFITSRNRAKHGIEKSHINDAMVISGMFSATRMAEPYMMLQFRRHFRQLHRDNILKGGRRKSCKRVHSRFGFRLYDVVEYEGKECYISSLRESGAFELRDSGGEVVSTGKSYKRLKFLHDSRGFLIM